MTKRQLEIGNLSPALMRRLFSTRVLKQLALGVEPPEILEIKRSFAVADGLPDSITLADVFDASFEKSVRLQRSEYVYKNAIVQNVLMGKYSLNTTSANFEVRIGTSKVDVLLARNSLTAFEIKTERDELGRLVAQVEQYRKACRFVQVLTSEKHASAVERLLPESAGISILTKHFQISTLRPSTQDASGLDRTALLGLLRKHEMVRLLEKVEKGRAAVPNTRLFSTLVRAASAEPLETIEKYVAASLLKRSAIPAALLKTLPRSVAACALAMDLTTPQSERLIRAFRVELTGEPRCLPTIRTSGESSTN